MSVAVSFLGGGVHSLGPLHALLGATVVGSAKFSLLKPNQQCTFVNNKREEHRP